MFSMFAWRTNCLRRRHGLKKKTQWREGEHVSLVFWAKKSGRWLHFVTSWDKNNCPLIGRLLELFKFQAYAAVSIFSFEVSARGRICLSQEVAHNCAVRKPKLFFFSENAIGCLFDLFYYAIELLIDHLFNHSPAIHSCLLLPPLLL